MGGITTALASFSVESENEAKHAGSGPVTKRTTQAIVLMLLPISIGMIAYALFTFFWRSRCMERKQVSTCLLLSVTLCHISTANSFEIQHVRALWQVSCFTQILLL